MMHYSGSRSSTLVATDAMWYWSSIVTLGLYCIVSEI